MKNLLVKTVITTVFAAIISVSHGAENPAESPAQKIRIALAGDSTVAPKGGWGDEFAKLLAPGIECINLARGGRSSKSFRDEGHWRKVLDAKADWVLIQFGHNDVPGKGPERETDAQMTYRENMARYVDEVRQAGAKPVLVTSVTRRNFDAQGKIKPDSTAPYVEAVRAVAAGKNVPLIDLNTRSVEQMNKLGPEAGAEYNRASAAPAKPDTTHLSPKGEAETAKLVTDDIRAHLPELAKLLAEPSK